MQLRLSENRKKEVIRGVKNTALVILGTFVLAFGISLFIFPFKLVTGGIPGISIIVQDLFSRISFMPDISESTYSSIINWILFIIGFFILGRKFALKTLVFTVVYPFALALFEALAGGDMFGGFFNLMSDRYAVHGDAKLVLATVFAGACIGAGCAITLRAGGSTGGLDIIALVLCKYFKRLKTSHILLVCDTIIVILGMFVIKDLVTSLLGIVSAFICSLTISKIFVGTERAVIAHIVSDKYKEINAAIIARLNRTTTLLDCVGGYSAEKKKLLIATITMRQYAEFTAIVDSIDKQAFMTIHRAQEIDGEGWSYNLDKKVKIKDVAQGELE